MSGAIKDIVKECLTNIRSSRRLVSLSLRINPYSPFYHQLTTLSTQLQQQQKIAQQLLLAHRVPPQLLTLSPVLNFVFTASSIISDDFTYDSLVLRLARNQTWANNSIRDLNQLGLEEKEIRELLIGFRNSLEAFTAEKQLKSKITQTIKQIL